MFPLVVVQCLETTAEIKEIINTIIIRHLFLQTNCKPMKNKWCFEIVGITLAYFVRHTVFMLSTMLFKKKWESFNEKQKMLWNCGYNSGVFCTTYSFHVKHNAFQEEMRKLPEKVAVRDGSPPLAPRGNVKHVTTKYGYTRRRLAQRPSEPEPPLDKTNKMTVRPAKTHNSLGGLPIWSAFAVRSVGS